MRKFQFIAILTIAISVPFISCRDNSTDPYMDTHFALGTVCSITLYEENDNFSFTEAFNLIDEVEDLMSTEIKGSEIDNININAGNGSSGI